MSVLTSELRNRLARVVTQAREVAEVGARVALESLAVHHHEVYRHMSPEERNLRNRLREHGRHLGDTRSEKTRTQTMEHLVQECAYEHWHRMLFARFLAENHLLIEPEMNVPVTLEECEELAKEQGTDQWTLASRFAQRMLPQVFRADHPVFEVTFAREHRVKLEGLLESLPPEVFKASDSLGWVYQFWQADKKDQVNGSEVKIGADELPAVTQLFTEPYMVQFLLHNSLGAWWVTRHSGKSCPVDLTYLRYAPSSSGHARGGEIPAAGTFDAWPNDLSRLKLLDPCCGSGHFLVAAFLMLVPMRMQAEGLSARDAVDAVLRDNLHGLEIDQRCIEIAAFALALEAWRYPDASGYRPLPLLNLAWCGQPLPYKEDEWLKLANGDDRLRAGMHSLYMVFRDAPLLGSLIDPRRAVSADLLTADYGELRPLLIQALENKVAESAEGYGGEQEAALRETAISAQGMALAADLLSRSYHLVITNVPYLTRGKQSNKLKEFCERRYPNAKNDLANVFLERCLELCREDDAGVVQIVMPENWLYLTTYRKERETLLSLHGWTLLAKLGFASFQVMDWWAFGIVLLTIRHRPPVAGALIASVVCSSTKEISEKSRILATGPIATVSQQSQLRNPDSRVTLTEVDATETIGQVASALQGIKTGDDGQYVFCFWELPQMGPEWRTIQSTVDSTTLYGGLQHVLRWRDEGSAIARLQGRAAWGRPGVAVSLMNEIRSALFIGQVFDSNVSVVTPKDSRLLPSLWAYCYSSEFNRAVKEIEPGVKANNGALTKIEFNHDRWAKEAVRLYPQGLPKPHSDDPTQWIFHGHPRPATSPLQVAVAGLLGYSWPAELNKEMELSDDACAWIAKAKKVDKLSDNDGIVCFAAIHGELPAHERLLRLLETAWGEEWNAGVLNKLLADVGFASKTLEVWLRDKFFEQHCALFHQRPFIWHIWDGLKDGFAALLNYHKLDRTNLERLIYSYLGDWIRMQEQAKRSGEDGAEERLAAAQGLKKRLEAILKGEDPLDIFVRWKPIEQQPIGWEPDLNDGVRLNIRPFMLVDDVGKKGAGILRTRPNIDWKKDRGKDVPDSPWYDQFKGERINDWHLKLAEKQAARSSKGLEN